MATTYRRDGYANENMDVRQYRASIVGDAAIDVQPALGLLPLDQLVAEIVEADRRLFEAFDTCNIDAYAGYLSRDLEFYHDKGGKTGYQDQLDSL